MTLFYMTLLDFARGPEMNAALVIFLVGMLWHVFGVLLLGVGPGS